MKHMTKKELRWMVSIGAAKNLDEFDVPPEKDEVLAVSRGVNGHTGVLVRLEDGTLGVSFGRVHYYDL